MKQLIKKYEPGHAAFETRAAVAERYYRNETDILFRDKPKEDKEESDNPLRNADNRIPRNFHGLIVNQKASYAFTAPPLFDVGNVTANKRITEALGDEYAKNCMGLCVNAANTSIGWVHYWTGDNGFEWAVVPSAQIIPAFDRSLKRRLIGVMRVYPDIDEDTGDNYTVYEYWTDTECQAFRRRTGDELEMLASRLHEGVRNLLQQEQRRLSGYKNRIPSAAYHRISDAKMALLTVRKDVVQAVTSSLFRHRHRLELLQQRLADASPEKLLARGYSITLKDGKVVKNADELQENDMITTRLQNGEVVSIVHI